MNITNSPNNGNSHTAMTHRWKQRLSYTNLWMDLRFEITRLCLSIPGIRVLNINLIFRQHEQKSIATFCLTVFKCSWQNQCSRLIDWELVLWYWISIFLHILWFVRLTNAWLHYLCINVLSSRKEKTITEYLIAEQCEHKTTNSSVHRIHRVMSSHIFWVQEKKWLENSSTETKMVHCCSI